MHVLSYGNSLIYFSQGKKGRSAKNAQANQPLDGKEDLYLKAPHSFVFHRGHVGKTVKELVLDVRKLMEPYTASSLKVNLYTFKMPNDLSLMTNI